jgi:hypothetical protein
MAAAVPFAMKAAPFVAQGLGALLGKKASGPSKLQQQAMQGTEQAAGRLEGASAPMLQQGQQYGQEGLQTIRPAAGYFRNILSSRTAARESLAPEMKNALDFYRGAANKTQRTMQGGSRDVAQAELEREKVGNLAMMQPMARQQAAQGAMQAANSLFGAGSDQTGQGMYGLGTAAQLRGQQFRDATVVRNQEGQGGSAWGSFLFDLAQQMPWGQKKIPSRNPVPIGVPGTEPPNLPRPGPINDIPSRMPAPVTVPPIPSRQPVPVGTSVTPGPIPYRSLFGG